MEKIPYPDNYQDPYCDEEEIIEDWYCPYCEEYLSGKYVTYEEMHDKRQSGCGYPVKCLR